MILCDNCQTKSCNKIIGCETLSCGNFTSPPLDVKVGDTIWCMTKYPLSNHCFVFIPCKLYITSMNTTTLFCDDGFRRAKLNKSEYKTIFFLTKEECMEACNICTRKQILSYQSMGSTSSLQKKNCCPLMKFNNELR